MTEPVSEEELIKSVGQSTMLHEDEEDAMPERNEVAFCKARDARGERLPRCCRWAIASFGSD